MSQIISLSISGMTCGHCVASVERALRTVPGIEQTDVEIGSAALRLAPGSSQASVVGQAIDTLQDAGYAATAEGRDLVRPALAPTSCCSAPSH